MALPIENGTLIDGTGAPRPRLVADRHFPSDELFAMLAELR
jgi:hypothetical protein